MNRKVLVLLAVLFATLFIGSRFNTWHFRELPPNVIRWQTQSEDNTFGYDVYRGDSEEGPFHKINTKTIAGAGTTDIPQRYEYRDSLIAPDKVYWYYVEGIALSGERAAITPVYPSRPKSTSFW